MEYPDNKPRPKRAQRQEIGGQLLADSIIGEIDRLEEIGKQNRILADKLTDLIGQATQTKITVDTDALDAKEKEFATALEKQVERIRTATRTIRAALWLMIVVLFLVFAAGYCYLDTLPWKAKYLQLEQQYNVLQQEIQTLQAAQKPTKKRK